MVYVMKSPKQRKVVIKPMPVIKGQFQEQNAEEDVSPCGKEDPGSDSESLFDDPLRSRKD